MAEGADIDSVLTTLCTTSRNKDDTDFTKMFDVVERLRQVILVPEAGNNPVPAVLNNDIVFNSVFCFLLDAHRAVRYLEELGSSAIKDWPTMAEMEPLEFIQKISLQAVSEEEKTAVIIFLCSALRLLVTMNETLNLARETRVRKRAGVPDGGDFEDRISDIQQGLNKALINCVHLEKLMHNRNPEERAICAEQTR